MMEEKEFERRINSDKQFIPKPEPEVVRDVEEKPKEPTLAERTFEARNNLRLQVLRAMEKICSEIAAGRINQANTETIASLARTWESIK